MPESRVSWDDDGDVGEVELPFPFCPECPVNDTCPAYIGATQGFIAGMAADFAADARSEEERAEILAKAHAFHAEQEAKAYETASHGA